MIFLLFERNPTDFLPACVGWIPHILHQDQMIGALKRVPGQGQ